MKKGKHSMGWHTVYDMSKRVKTQKIIIIILSVLLGLSLGALLHFLGGE